MKIIIKTDLIYLEIEDVPVNFSDRNTAFHVPEAMKALKPSIDEAIRLHNEVKNNLSK